MDYTIFSPHLGYEDFLKYDESNNLRFVKPTTQEIKNKLENLSKEELLKIIEKVVLAEEKKLKLEK